MTLHLIPYIFRAKEWYILIDLPEGTYKDAEMDMERWVYLTNQDRQIADDCCQQEILLEEAKMIILKK